MSDAEDAKDTVPAAEPRMSEAERAERQHDARFTVEGPAPDWAIRMFADVKPADGQTQS